MSPKSLPHRGKHSLTIGQIPYSVSFSSLSFGFLIAQITYKHVSTLSFEDVSLLKP